MKHSCLKFIETMVCLVAAVLLLYLAFRGMSLDRLAEEFRQADYRWVWLSLVFGVLGHFCRAWRWRLMCEPLGRMPSVMHTLAAVMTGYLANFAFPRAGEVARCAVLRRTDGLPVEKLVGTVVVERAIDLLMVLLMLAVLLLARFELFGTFLQRELWQPFTERMAGHSVLAGCLLTACAVAAVWCVLFFRRHHFSQGPAAWVARMARGVLEGLTALFRMRRRGAFVAFTLLLWAAYFLQTYVVFFAVPATSGLDATAGVFVLVMCSLGFVVPVQGAIGAYHWIVSLSLLLYGVARADGLVYATIAHTSGSLLSIVMGFLALVYLGFMEHGGRKAA